MHIAYNPRADSINLVNLGIYATMGGVAFAAFMALSMVFVPALAAGSYTIVNNFNVKEEQDDVVYKVMTTAPIPEEANDHINGLPLTVLGYGWLDFDTLESDDVVTGVFATIHPAFTDSTFATGDKWHAHTGLVAPVTVGEDTILCLVFLASPDFELKTAGATLHQSLAAADATVGSAEVDGATSFTLQLNGNCPSVEIPVLSETAGLLNIEVVAPSP